MLRRVALDQVRLGMFVHAMEGSWLRHPFWRRRFLLDNPLDLSRLLDSDIPGIIIDDERGIAPEEPRPAAPFAPPRPRPEADGRSLPRLATREADDAQQEIKSAKLLLGRSKRAVIKLFGEVRMGRALQVEAIAPLVEEIAVSVARNPAVLLNIARIKRKDEYTYMHSVAVCALMINFARALELDEDLVRELGLAGLLHDIGKMAVPDALLTKPARLTADEYVVVREHAQRGYDMIVGSDNPSAIVADVVLHHHERYDGSGYPHGLTSGAISLHARMGAICDVYDAITSNRPYKDAWSPTDAIAKMLEWQGQFDPGLLDAFIRSLGIYPVGTLVRLRSNRLGMVVSENKRTPTRPRVTAFYAIPERVVIRPEPVTIGPSIRDDAILHLERAENWHFRNWPELRTALLGS